MTGGRQVAGAWSPQRTGAASMFLSSTPNGGPRLASNLRRQALGRPRHALARTRRQHSAGRSRGKLLRGTEAIRHRRIT